MQAFIKHRQSFKNAVACDAVSWSLPIDSIEADNGSIQLVGELPVSYAGSWLCFSGEVYVIDRVEPSNGMTAVTVIRAAEAFSRPLIYTAPESGTSIGSFILAQLAANYQQCSDPAYVLPYLDIVNTDHTYFVAPNADNNGLYTLSDYLRQIRQCVVCNIYTAGDLLRCAISTAPPQEHTMLDGVNGYQLLQQTYSRNSVSKVTVVQAGASTDYYLSATGQVSTAVPQQRAAGEWRVIASRDKADGEEEARKIFNENIEGYKITFSANERMLVFDTVRLRINGEPITAQITAVRRSSGDYRYQYECGALLTTLSGRLRSCSSIEALGGVSAKGGAVDGNLGVLGRMEAHDTVTFYDDLVANNKIILGAGSYGTTLPTTDLRAGRVFFLRLPDGG